jgi:hypothetical protein
VGECVRLKVQKNPRAALASSDIISGVHGGRSTISALMSSLSRFGDQDGQGEDAVVEACLDSLNVEVLAEEDLTGEEALRSLPREDLVAFPLLEEPLCSHVATVIFIVGALLADKAILA